MVDILILSWKFRKRPFEGPDEKKYPAKRSLLIDCIAQTISGFRQNEKYFEPFIYVEHFGEK